MRVVRGECGRLRLGRCLPGRGAWLCAGPSRCLDLAEQRQAFSRAFRTAVPPEAINRLRAELSARAELTDRQTEPHILVVCQDEGWHTSEVGSGPERRDDDGAEPHGED